MRFLARPRRLVVYLTAVAVFAMALFYLLLVVAPCMVGSGCYKGYHSAFSFDADRAHYPAWMKDIPDEVNLTSLSIPGTHDTMTHDIGQFSLQCQKFNLSIQLEAGLRYFDIRARLRNDRLHIYHANGFTGYSFKDVLVTMFEFLHANPSETIIMRLKEEGKPLGTNSVSFEQAFNFARQNASETADEAGEHLFPYNPMEGLPIPTLGELRSRIFLLQNFEATGGPYGMEWEGDQMALEDIWIIPDVYHLAEKWTAIRTALETAATSPLDDGLLYLAHLSASVGVLPIEAAAGPMNRTIAGMNDMTGQWLRDFEDNADARRTGVVIIDFPGKALIDTIIRWNKPFMKSI